MADDDKKDKKPPKDDKEPKSGDVEIGAPEGSEAEIDAVNDDDNLDSTDGAIEELLSTLEDFGIEAEDAEAIAEEIFGRGYTAEEALENLDSDEIAEIIADKTGDYDSDGPTDEDSGLSEGKKKPEALEAFEKSMDEAGPKAIAEYVMGGTSHSSNNGNATSSGGSSNNGNALAKLIGSLKI